MVLCRRVAITLATLGVLTACKSEREQEFLTLARNDAEAVKKFEQQEFVPVQLNGAISSYGNEDRVLVEIVPEPGNETVTETDPETGGEAPAGTAAPTGTVPVAFDAVCRNHLYANSAPLFPAYTASCVGKQVQGSGYVVLSLPGKGIRIKARDIEYEFDPAATTAPALKWFDKVVFTGTLARIEGQDRVNRPRVTAARIEPYRGSETPEMANVRKALQFASLCQDGVFKEQAEERLATGYEHIAGIGLGDVAVKALAIKRGEPDSGFVEIGGHRPVRCLINKGKVEESYTRVATITPGDLLKQFPQYEYQFWVDRAVAEAQSKAYLAAQEKQVEAARKAFAALPEKEKFQRVISRLEAAAEAIASFIDEKYEANTYLDMCNIEMRSGLDSYKRTGLAEKMREADATCVRRARQLCTPNSERRACLRLANVEPLPW